MSKIQTYFENNEVDFQLEVNLQAIRRELVRLLDESELTECFTCNKLKCSCSKTLKLTYINGDRTEDKINKSHEEIKAWIKSCSAVIEASKTGKEVANITWPPALSSIWNDKLDLAKLLSSKSSFRKPANVEAFFKNVGDMKLTAENISGVLKYLQKSNNATANAMLQYLTNASNNRSMATDTYSFF